MSVTLDPETIVAMEREGKLKPISLRPKRPVKVKDLSQARRVGGNSSDSGETKRSSI